MLIASVVILGGVVWWVGLAETLQALRESGPMAFIGVGLVSLAVLLLQGAAWSRLNRPIGHDIPYHTLVSATTVGLAVNIVTPSSYLGGEAVRVLYVARRTGLSLHELAGTVVLVKYVEALSFALLFALCTAATAIHFRGTLFSEPYLPVGVMIMVAAAVFCGICLLLWIALYREWMPLTVLIFRTRRWFSRSRLMRRLSQRTRDMEQQVHRVFNQEKATASGTFLILLLSHLTMFVRPAVFFGIGGATGLSFGELALIFVATQALLAAQVTPSGVGTLDGGMLLVFTLVDQTPTACMAYLLCLRFWDGVVIAIGLWLATQAGADLLEKPSRQVAANESRDEA